MQRSRWPGLLRRCVRALRAFLNIFCAAFCAFFSVLFFSGFLFLIGVNTSFIDVESTELVMQYFLLFHFCILRHFVTTVLHNCLFVCLLTFLLFDIICVLRCLHYFFQCFCALRQCFFAPHCSFLSLVDVLQMLVDLSSSSFVFFLPLRLPFRCFGGFRSSSFRFPFPFCVC